MYNSINMCISGYYFNKGIKNKKEILTNNKEIITLLCMLFVLINSMSLNL